MNAWDNIGGGIFRTNRTIVQLLFWLETLISEANSLRFIQLRKNKVVPNTLEILPSPAG